jgi:hypothetical protein
MYLVAFGEQQLRQVGTVLAGDAGDECFFHVSPLIMDCRAAIPSRRLTPGF